MSWKTRLHQALFHQTMLYVHHFGGYSQRAIKSDSHSFKITCDKSAVSLLASGEQRYIKAIPSPSSASSPSSSYPGCSLVIMFPVTRLFRDIIRACFGNRIVYMLPNVNRYLDLFIFCPVDVQRIIYPPFSDWSLRLGDRLHANINRLADSVTESLHVSHFSEACTRIYIGLGEWKFVW